MPAFFSNLGFDFLNDSRQDFLDFSVYVAEKSTKIRGYHGECYYNCHLGEAQFILRTQRVDQNGNLELLGVDTHGRGRCIWDVKVVGKDLTPRDSDVLSRRVRIAKGDTGGFAVLNVVNADVLPSYLPGDTIKVQMIAFPVEIDYYESETAMFEELGMPLEDNSLHRPQIGRLYPTGYLENRKISPEKARDEKTSDLTLLHATVKGFRDGDVSLDGKVSHSYVRCLVDTEFGELEIVHMCDQVKEEQQDYMRAGAVVTGLFVLSGDVAIYDYEEGIVRDHEHNLKLLRDVLHRGDAARLSMVLADNATYTSDHVGETFVGKDDVLSYINYVADGINVYCYPHLATVLYVEDDECDMPARSAGTRCLALAYGDPKHIESIAFIDTDDEGYITHIHTTSDERYRFLLDHSRNTKQDDLGDKNADGSRLT